MDLFNLVNFILIEENGLEIVKFITEQFGEFKLIEHFQTFFRYRIETKISVGKVFGSFE